MKPQGFFVLTVTLVAVGLALMTAAPAFAQSFVLTKELGSGQSPNPPPGGQVVFVITIKNTNPQQAPATSLFDTQDPCFAPITNCSQVVCAGGLRCGTCQVTPSGFNVMGYQLAGAGGTGDTITFTVTTTAGPNPGTCRNTATTMDPFNGTDVSARATVIIGSGIGLTKRLASGQTGTPLPGAPVVFEVVMTNVTTQPLTGLMLIDTMDGCFQAITCAQVTCSGGTSCGTCATNPGGFTYTGISLAPSGQTEDTITFTVNATAGNAPGVCGNTAASVDPITHLDVISRKTVNIGTGLALTKTLGAGQSSSPPAGTPVVFTITAKNNTPQALTGVDLFDTLDGCFQSIGSCSQVVCSGSPPACGTCAVGAGGFSIRGFNLAPLGQTGDTLTWTVTVTAGTQVGNCSNTATAVDPLSGTDLQSRATVTISPGLTLAKSLPITQNPSPPAGSPVVFDITITNRTGLPVSNGVLQDALDPCFAPFTSCAAVVCTGGTSCGTCTPVAGGFQVAGYALAPAGQTGDSIKYQVTVTAGANPGICLNRVATVDPVTQRDLSAFAQVLITPPGTVGVTKDLAPGQSPTPAPGQPVRFTVTIANLSATPVTSGTLVEQMDLCFTGVQDCTTQVSCSGTGCGTCTLAPQGFNYTYSLAPAGSPGDSVTWTVTTQAGSTLGACFNHASTMDPGGSTLSDRAGVTITGAASCSLNYDDVVMPPGVPMNWPKNPPWVYTAPCGTGGTPTLSLVLLNPVVEGDLQDDITSPLGAMRLYQVECGAACPQKIGLAKNTATGKVQLAFLP